MKKILYVANITQHIIRFHLPYLSWFKEQGYEVHVAANGNDKIENCDIFYNIPIQRTLFSAKNLEAYHKLFKIINENKYDLVIGNTSIASGLARLAGREARKNGTKVLYFAHGLNFYKGAPLKSWLIYYPLERFFSFLTDIFISINSEDYNRLSKWYPLKTCKINGVGVKSERFCPVDISIKNDYRKELNYNEKELILTYTAEFIDRKNHRFIIDATIELAQKIPNIKVLFLGRGALLDTMKKYAVDRNVDKFIDFLGFRTDVPKLIAISDIGISASKFEGLGLNIVEEMFMALPIVATVDKGHKELVKQGVNGYLFEQNNQLQFVEYVCKLASSTELRLEMGKQSVILAQKFGLQSSLKQFVDIINPLLNK